jgi:hypothetical protein
MQFMPILVLLQPKSGFSLTTDNYGIADDCEVAKAAAMVRSLKEEEAKKIESDLKVAVLNLSKAKAKAQARAKKR